MAQKILYFTAGPKATSAEIAQIATLNALAAPAYEVCVMSGAPKAQLTSTKLSAAQADNSYNDAGASITGTGISAAASDNSLNDSGNGFVRGGFQVGDVLTIAGFTGETSNNTAGAAIVVSVTAAKMVLKGVTLKNDSAGESVTVTSAGRFLTRGFKVGQTIMVRGFTGDRANNISSGVITALTASKMTIGGTDGDVIVNDAAGESVTICTVACSATYGGLVAIADFVAGTVPEQYKTNRTAIYTVFDPANPPDAPALIDTQTVLSSGETVELDTAGTVTFTVAEGDISAADVAATESVVSNGDTVTLNTHEVTLAVADHAITPSLPATKAIVSNGDETVAGGVSATAVVSGGAMTGVLVGATRKVVSTGAVIPITSGSGTTQVTLTIAGGEITACVLS